MFRVVKRNSEGEAVSLRFPIIVMGTLFALAVIGGTGAVIVQDAREQRQAIETRMGPKGNFAALPLMNFHLSGHREIEVKVLLELDPRTDPEKLAPYLDRIADRLGDRIRAAEEDRLTGPGSTQFVKNTVTAVVDREARTIKVRDVLVEHLLVK